MMAVSVENVGHGSLPPENNRTREDHETGIIKRPGLLPTTRRDDRPLQASQGQGRGRSSSGGFEAAALVPRLSPPPSLPHPPALGTKRATTTTTTTRKRRRPAHDVDGPHTERLSCKKRRLRRDLITSRLSRPYSMPATHIIHREASAAGDKRFMKLAAVARSRKLNAVVVPTPEDYGARMPTAAAAAFSSRPAAAPGGYRQQQQQYVQGPVVPLNQTGSHHMQASSEIVRRAAILNRIRLKLRSHERRASVVEGVEATAAPRVVTASNEQGTEASSSSQASTSGSWHPPSTEAGSSTHNIPPPPPPPPPNPSTAAADVLHLGRLSPRLKPLRSPELRASTSRSTQIIKPMDEDQLDDDSLSFPNNSVLFADDACDDSSLGEDVYADFSVIFGGLDAGGAAEGSGIDATTAVGGGDGGGGVGPGEAGVGVVPVGTEHFEDYMDDLDGIPRAVR